MGVGKVMQELHGMLKLVFVIMVATTYVCCWTIGAGDDREVHKVGMVVTKEWRKVKSADAGIRICLSCRDNSSFRLNSLGPLCLLQCLGYCTVAKWVPMGTFFSFWVSIGSLFLFQGPHFLYLGIKNL